MIQNVRNSRIIFGVWLLMIVMFTACIKEEFTLSKLDTSVDLDPALATPLGYFDFRMDENLQTSENAIISSNPDRIVSLNYFGEIISEPAGDLFSFDPVNESYSIPNPTGGIIDLSRASYELELSDRVPFFLSNSGGDAKLDSVLLASGIVRISEIEFPDAIGQVLLVIPGLKLNGESFEAELNHHDNLVMSEINGYTLELTSEEERKNLIDVELYVRYPRQANILFASLPLVSFDFEIVAQEWEIIYGYLGQEYIDFGRVSFSTDLKENFPGGEFYSIDPRLTFKISNSYSVPLAMGLSNIVAQTNESGEILLEGDGIPEPPDYFYPAYPEDALSIGEARDSFIIDSDNSNLEEITTSSPTRIDYGVEFLTNPGENKLNNTIFSESKYVTRVELQLPFHGRAKLLSVQDTMVFDFSRLNFPVDEMINQVIFKLYYENSFPAEIDLQLYLADENLEVSDTLFDSFTKVKPAKPVDRFVEDLDFVSGELEAYLPGDKLQNVRDARYIIGEALLSTNKDYDVVKIFDNQNLFLNMGIVFDISTSIEDF